MPPTQRPAPYPARPKQTAQKEVRPDAPAQGYPLEYVLEQLTRKLLN
jgi:hypothetical protein